MRILTLNHQHSNGANSLRATKLRSAVLQLSKQTCKAADKDSPSLSQAYQNSARENKFGVLKLKSLLDGLDWVFA